MVNQFMSRLFRATVIVTKLLSAVNGAAFPHPTGPFNTTLSTAELIDHHRNDPFASTPTPRRLMISIFEPTIPSKCSATLVNYIEPITAAFEDSQFAQYGIPQGTFESLQLQTCKPGILYQNPTAPQKPCGTYPLIIFSPGLEVTRLFYSALAQE
jgi:hypothetical protein